MHRKPRDWLVEFCHILAGRDDFHAALFINLVSEKLLSEREAQDCECELGNGS
jgi:hypothetical protein